MAKTVSKGRSKQNSNVKHKQNSNVKHKGSNFKKSFHKKEETGKSSKFDKTQKFGNKSFDGKSKFKKNFHDKTDGNEDRPKFDRNRKFGNKSSDGKKQISKSKKRWNDKHMPHDKYRKKDDEEGSDFEEVTDKIEKAKTWENANSSSSENDSSEDENERNEVRKLKAQQNRKKKKSGGFQSMGLSHSVYKGIIRKGYQIPTPIQRKTVPIIMDGKDMVAMARTGSGKTAAFLIPMFEKLQTHVAKSGARALILSPTRELAVQTLKFAKELGKFTGLRAAVVLGGDRMEDQFAALHENPDIIVATPGRFMHVVVEMNLKLKSVQYVVFDEADRLFEMGFEEQMSEILSRLPDSRQTLLFSATLPKLLVEFAKAGLHDPTLIRLDVDTKLSEDLKLSFLHCRANDKLATLLYLLKQVIPAGQQTVVFAATKHHVEYIHMILQKMDISSTYIYSSLDPTARKIGIAKFQHRKSSVMVVTDLAARGIDIPLLDNVINFNFPAKGKLFVHRVGRVARAGRTGVAYSLIAPDEIAYMFDLHVFLGRTIKYVPIGKSVKDDDGLYGKVPQSLIDDSAETIMQLHEENYDIQSMVKVITNAYGHYIRSRPMPAAESIKRVKQMEKLGQYIGVHPLFGIEDNSVDAERQKVLNALKSYKSDTTIFEINSTSKNTGFSIMKQKRSFHQTVVQSKLDRMEDYKHNSLDKPGTSSGEGPETADELDVRNVFTTVIGGKRPQIDQSVDSEHLSKKQKRDQMSGKDEENYISYKPTDYHVEQGLQLGTDFDREAAGAILDINGDDENNARRKDNVLRWDRKKKKYVRDNNEDPKKKKIRTESGVWISASYKSNAYKDWIHKTKRDTGVEREEDESEADSKSGSSRQPQPTSANRLMVMGGDVVRKHRQGADGPGGKKNKFKNKRGGILKRPEQILKARKIKAQKEAFQNNRKKENTKNRSTHAQKGKKS